MVIFLVCDSSRGSQPRSAEHSICPNHSVGNNNNGSFGVNDVNLLASACNVRLGGAFLCAGLRAVEGESKAAKIRLDGIFRIDSRFGAKKIGTSSHPFDTKLHEQVPVAAPLHYPPGSSEIRKAVDKSPPLYPPFDAFEDSYRICNIEPGRWDDPVCCTIATCFPTDEQRHSYLSYVFGDQDHTVEFHLNSRAERVTHNLFVEMRRLRWHGIRTI